MSFIISVDLELPLEVLEKEMDAPVTVESLKAFIEEGKKELEEEIPGAKVTKLEVKEKK